MKKSTASAKSSKKKDSKKKKPLKVSYHRRPDGQTLDLWQLNLRKQFGEENPFEVENVGNHPFFSEFNIWNPSTRNSYQVNIAASIPAKGLPAFNSLHTLGNTCNCQDFKTNRLGLCKHISSVLNKLSKSRGFKSAFRRGHTQEGSMIYVDYREEPRIRLYIGSEQQASMMALTKKWFDTDGFLKTNGFAYFEKIIHESRNIDPEFKCLDDAYQFIAERRENIRRQAIINKLLPQGGDSPYLDSLLKVKLFPYQRTGVYFAAKAGRCMIADEMGLGKTIQAIGAAEVLRREMGIQKVLVVCPTSLKYQWKMEIEKFCDAQVNVIEGTQAKRKIQYESDTSFFQIISYNTIANDTELISAMDADMMIIDEAQRIKNFRTKISMQLKKVHTPYCIVLTGTPLENKLEELYAITQFVDQYKLPPLYRFLDHYQIFGESGQVTGYKNLKEIAILLADTMIRRLKKDVLKQLPKRMDKNLFVPMTKEQKDIHRELADTVARLVARWRRMHFLSESDRLQLILSLSQMRMVADSTFILDQKTRFDTKIDELLCIFEEALAEPTQKIVIFSQWERMTRLVSQELDARDTGYAYLHGGIPSKNRQALLERFQNDPECRVFLSTDAGGVGLNLQAASLLINLDIPWNPAVLEQRIGRIHRMGQERNVNIINMVSRDSIEQRMLGILAFKSSMAQGVLDPDGDDTIFMSESKFKKFMDSVETITQDGWQPSETEASERETADIEDLEIPSAPSVDPKKRKKRDLVVQDTLIGDDDVLPDSSSNEEVADTLRKPTSSPNEHPRSQPSPEGSGESKTGATGNQKSPPSGIIPATPQDLVQTGISFFTGLSETLRSPEKTQKLVESIVAKDEQTGQVYLKIPVENAAVVENAMKLLGGLFAGLSGK